MCSICHLTYKIRKVFILPQLTIVGGERMYGREEPAGKYLALYKRDSQYEAAHRGLEGTYEKRMLFDKIKGFSGLEQAIEFAEENMPAIVMKRLPVKEEDLAKVKAKKPYVVIGEYYGKHKSYDYTGDCDWLRSYDAVRCNAEEVELMMEQMAREKYFVKAYRGLELKLL